jgi:ubiquinone/menaquinone biosynthesis C-methylase UbiE
VYQHPLAYLLGIEGTALLRAWAGDHDEAFVADRLAEVRRLLDTPALADHPGVHVRRGDLATAYRAWAQTYDEPRNGLFDADEPTAHEILAGLGTGTALDAACGTGRYAAHLAARGHRVLGVDADPDMLARARRRVPAATFARADLHRLPLADSTVDTAVCALALVHVPDLAPVFAELARVLRPGGHLVVTDVHHELVRRGSVVHSVGPDGTPGWAPTYRHGIGDYLRAALPAGLEVRRCEEPPLEFANPPGPAPERIEVGDWADWPWTLLPLVPAATRSAWTIPSVVVWQFRRVRRR